MTDSDRSDSVDREKWVPREKYHKALDQRNKFKNMWHNRCAELEWYEENSVPISELEALADDKENRRDIARGLYDEHDDGRYFWAWIIHRAHAIELRQLIADYGDTDE